MSDIEVYDRQGFGNTAGLGDKAALLIVDFVVGFCDPAQFGGGNIATAVRHTQTLLEGVRARGLPVAYSRIVYADDGADAGAMSLKVPGLLAFTEANPIGAIVDDLAPRTGEYIVRKTQPSAFFGTGLAGWLIGQGVDSVIVTGATTSGCVRASVVDAMSHNFRTVVATECVGDRALGPHEASLFDMGQKYADLMTNEEIFAALGAP